MADVIQWARTAQRSGVLKLSDGSGKEIRVAFRDGRIVFSSNNARREAISRYLVFLGLCTQADLEEAIRVQEITGAQFVSVLVRSGKMTEQQAIDTLTEKTMEDLCDVFLWRDGSFDFVPTAGGKNASLAIGLDPIRVVSEGVRRVEVWNRINSIVHPRSYFEKTDAPFPEAATWEDERMARTIRSFLDGERSISELVEILPFSRYKIYRAVSELLEKRLIGSGEVTEVLDREQRTRAKLHEAEISVSQGKWTEAIEILHGLSTANPGRQDIMTRLLQVTDGFRRSVYEHNFDVNDIPVVTIGPDALSRLALDPSDGFILSRIDGRMSVQKILRISPQSEFEGLRALKRLLNAKVIDFPSRHSTTDSKPDPAPKSPVTA